MLERSFSFSSVCLKWNGNIGKISNWFELIALLFLWLIRKKEADAKLISIKQVDSSPPLYKSRLRDVICDRNRLSAIEISRKQRIYGREEPISTGRERFVEIFSIETEIGAFFCGTSLSWVCGGQAFSLSFCSFFLQARARLEEVWKSKWHHFEASVLITDWFNSWWLLLRSFFLIFFLHVVNVLIIPK